MSGSNALFAQYAQGVNPLGMANQVMQFQSNQQALQQRQFELGQAKLQPIYAGITALLGKQNPTYGDINSAIAEGVRLGGDGSGIMQNLQEYAGQPGASPRGFIEHYMARYVPPFEAAQLSTGHGISPEMYYRMITTGIGPGGATFQQPFGQVWLPGQAGPAVAAPGATTAQPTAPPAAQEGAPAAPATPAGTAGQAAQAGPQGPQGPAGEAGAAGPAGEVQQAQTGAAIAARMSRMGRFSHDLMMTESNGHNVPSEVDSGGPTEVSQGFFQISTPTARQFAKAAGLDPRSVESGVMHLNFDQQQQLVNEIPFGRFGPRTKRMMEAIYGPIDPRMTIGQLDAQFGGGGGTMVAGPGGAPTVTNVPIVTGRGPPTATAGNIATDVAPPVGLPGIQQAAYAPPAAGGPPVLPPGYTPLFVPGGGIMTPPAGTMESFQAAGQAAGQRSLALQAQLNVTPGMRAQLAGMETELDAAVKTGLGSRTNSTIRQLMTNMGFSRADQGQVAEQQAAQEQFNKFAQIVVGSTLQGFGTAITNDRQALAEASNPGIELSYLGNKGIIHMLKGQLVATQVMGKAWQDQLDRGASPAGFDTWRNTQFTATDPRTGGRFDPRVFWMSQMTPEEQQKYWDNAKRNPADAAQLKRDMNYAENQGWIKAPEGGGRGFTSPY